MLEREVVEYPVRPLQSFFQRSSCFKFFIPITGMFACLVMWFLFSYKHTAALLLKPSPQQATRPMFDDQGCHKEDGHTTQHLWVTFFIGMGCAILLASRCYVQPNLDSPLTGQDRSSDCTPSHLNGQDRPIILLNGQDLPKENDHTPSDPGQDHHAEGGRTPDSGQDHHAEGDRTLFPYHNFDSTYEILERIMKKTNTRDAWAAI